MKTIFLCFCVFVLSSGCASAAELRIVASDTPVSGKILVASFVLDTQGDSLNAIEGTLGIPKSITVKEIQDGDSLINFWVERPHLEDGSIHFSGIVPGGFLGNDREIFTVVFEVTSTEDTLFTLADAAAYVHDGEGTKVLLTLARPPFILEALGARAHMIDTTPPEPFAITREHPQDFATDAWRVFFATQDKQSGIDHYEVVESQFPRIPRFSRGGWTVAVSPFEVRSENTFVYVKAVDRSGNIRIASLSPRQYSPSLMMLSILGILLLIVLIYQYAWKPRARRN